MPTRIRRTNASLRLGLLLYQGCMPAGLFAVSDMVKACNLRAGRERVSLVWVGVDSEPVNIGQGPALQPQAVLAKANCDVILVPGLWLTSVEELETILPQQQKLIDQLYALPRPTKLWGYCAGVALLAAAGRLDGEHAAMTWWLCDRMRERFPKALWQRGEILVTSKRAVTAAGANGYLPLLLDQLPSIYGNEVVRDVCEVLMLPQPRVRHDAFLAVDLMTLQDDGLRKLALFARRTPARELDLFSAANHANVSVRTLCRLVRNATGLAAGDWLRRIKLRQASEILYDSNTAIKQISDELGYSSKTSLQRAFKKTTGMTLAAYRQTYRA